MRDIIRKDLKVLIVAAVSLCAVFIGSAWLASSSCEARAKPFESHKWGFVQGCMVKRDGQWQPL